MKKILILLLTTLFMFSLVACGNKKPNQEELEETIKEKIVAELEEKSKEEHPDWKHAGYSSKISLDLIELNKWEVSGSLSVKFYEGEDNYNLAGMVLYYPEEDIFDLDLIFE